MHSPSQGKLDRSVVSLPCSLVTTLFWINIKTNIADETDETVSKYHSCELDGKFYGYSVEIYYQETMREKRVEILESIMKHNRV